MHEQSNPADHEKNLPELSTPHPVVTGVGAAGGGVVGAAIGNSVGGKVGATVGGIAGAIIGGIAGSELGDLSETLVQETSPSLSLGLGADTKEIELPAHYSWKELQALSKPQPEES